MTDPCRMGIYCRTRDSTLAPGPASSRGFCLPCERHGRTAISQLHTDYIKLADHLPATGGGFGGGIPTNRVEAPIPLRLGVDQVMRNIAWTLVTWEIPVREVARLSDVEERGVRANIAVGRASSILVNHYNVLMALGPTWHMDYSQDVVRMDGLDAIAMLTGLHHRALAVAGESVVREHRALPCPDCGRITLGRVLGEEIIDCSICGWECMIDEYTQYALTFIPPGKR